MKFDGKCPVCVKEGKTSWVTAGVGTTTCLYYPPYYDEEGKYHHHNGNRTTIAHTCTNGHRFSVSKTGSCACGWGGDAEVTIL
jgi:hypothetical protein